MALLKKDDLYDGARGAARRALRKAGYGWLETLAVVRHFEPSLIDRAIAAVPGAAAALKKVKAKVGGAIIDAFRDFFESVDWSAVLAWAFKILGLLLLGDGVTLAHPDATASQVASIAAPTAGPDAASRHVSDTAP